MNLYKSLLKFYEGKESSYSSSYSEGLYFAYDTHVIIFKGVKYGNRTIDKIEPSNYATKSDMSSLRSELEKSWTIGSATRVQSGLMSADDKKKLDSLANTLQVLSVQPLNDSSDISPASLIGSDRYDILKGITDKHIGVNAQFTDGKLTIGLYDFNKSEWVGAPSVTIPLQ